MSEKSLRMTQPLRKLVVLILITVLAFVVTELFVRFVLKYPYQVNGTRKIQIHNNLGAYNVITWRPPYYRYMSIEGNNKVFGFNNIGLPGIDINPAYEQNIFVMGSSFIEAKNVKSEDLATSQFQELLNKKNARTNVINLGSSGHDPYVMWHRLKFFEKQLKHKHTIVVFDPLSLTYLSNRWQDTLAFSPVPGLPRLLPQKPMVRLASLPRKYFASVNLLLQGFASQDNPAQDIPKNKDRPFKQSEKAWSKLEQCISMFSKDYSPNLLILSIIPDAGINNRISDLCLKYAVRFASNEKIVLPQYQTNGSGHLNEKGNALLGELLYKSYIQLESIEPKE